MELKVVFRVSADQWRGYNNDHIKRDNHEGQNSNAHGDNRAPMMPLSDLPVATPFARSYPKAFAEIALFVALKSNTRVRGLFRG
jgi:hypothetical protein